MIQQLNSILTRSLMFLSLILLSISYAPNAIAQKSYGKYGQCKSKTQKGSRCKNNASKTGYCGKHKEVKILHL
jgi:hypothetical protein